MPRLPRFHRHQEIARLQAHLERYGFPRMQMLLLVTLTGVSGFLASSWLLHYGLTVMWGRYLAAFGIAYLVFLGLLWVWLRTKADDYDQPPDLGSLDPTPSSHDHPHPEFAGGGGQSGGGGASGHFDGPISSSTPYIHLEEAAASPVDEVVQAAGETVAAADEFAIPLALILFIGMLLLSSLWMVYSAPVLFAELLVDGVLAASLYRRLRGLEARHWLETALRRTGWPFLVTALLVSAAGWGMSVYAPGAHSIGDVISYAKRAG